MVSFFRRKGEKIMEKWASILDIVNYILIFDSLVVVIGILITIYIIKRKEKDEEEEF